MSELALSGEYGMHQLPLIICGMGRSGTRSVADIMSSHENIQVYGEIPPQILMAYIDFLDVMDKAYLGNESFKEDWSRRKLTYMLDSFNALSKQSLNVKSLSFVRGYKSPRHEQFFRHLERHFQNVGVSAQYIYCTRHPLACWASYKSMPWNRFDIEGFILDYKESLKSFLEMRGLARQRVHLFRLEDYVNAGDRYSFFMEKFVEPLGVSDDGSILRAIEADINRNATVSVTRRPPEKLSPLEVRRINEDGELWGYIEKL